MRRPNARAPQKREGRAPQPVASSFVPQFAKRPLASAEREAQHGGELQRRAQQRSPQRPPLAICAARRAAAPRRRTTRRPSSAAGTARRRVSAQQSSGRPGRWPQRSARRTWPGPRDPIVAGVRRRAALLPPRASPPHGAQHGAERARHHLQPPQRHWLRPAGVPRGRHIAARGGHAAGGAHGSRRQLGVGLRGRRRRAALRADQRVRRGARCAHRRRVQGRAVDAGARGPGCAGAAAGDGHLHVHLQGGRRGLEGERAWAPERAAAHARSRRTRAPPAASGPSPTPALQTHHPQPNSRSDASKTRRGG